MPFEGAPKTSATVLVVDDEPVVLNCVSNALVHGGFDVLRAASPADALRIAATHELPIHLILCDVVMPQMNGPLLADRLLEVHPEAECLFMAGLPDHPEVTYRVVGRGLAFLPKPFMPQELVAKVREVLSIGAGRSMAAEA